MPKILFNFASRSRPNKLISAIQNIQDKIETSDYLILVTLDVDDTTCATNEFYERLKCYKHVMPVYGFSKNKIDAINKNVWMIDDFDILINMSDDMYWLEKGFDKVIEDNMMESFPDLDGFLHYHDMSRASDALCTLSIMGKKYYSRTNYIYHPDYANVYCDLEATEVAKALGKHRFFDIHLFEHRHPIWGKAEMDAQYLKTENKEGYAADYATYSRRRNNNFNI